MAERNFTPIANFLNFIDHEYHRLMVVDFFYTSCIFPTF